MFLLDIIIKKFKIFHMSYADKESALDAIILDGQMTPRFIFFSITASAIATLGLLLNSPAVIIGAMLISPLMGPIVMQGFAISLIDFSLFKKSLICLMTGTFFGIVTSFLIVKFSPITHVTAEILARTSPNLFDLLVAIFSGTAASYVSIKQKGTAIVGAAIATALMPPLAVTGYGLATQNWWISKGSFFLYLTNFIAIALAVVFVAIFYGFFKYRKQKYIFIQIASSLLTLVLLAIPLALALKDIAFQSYVTAEAKDIIGAHFTQRHDRLNDFAIDFGEDIINVDAVVITKTYRPEVKELIQKELESEISHPIKLNLTQIALTSNVDIPPYLKNLQIKNNLMNGGTNTIAKVDSTAEIQQKVIKQIWFPYKLVNVDQDSGIITIVCVYDPKVSLNNLRRQEIALANQFPDWIVRILPSQQRLPFIDILTKSEILDEENLKSLEDVVWALERWEIKDVVVMGYALSPKIGKTIKNNKSDGVNPDHIKLAVQYLEAKGFHVTIKIKQFNPSTSHPNRVDLFVKDNIYGQEE